MLEMLEIQGKPGMGKSLKTAGFERKDELSAPLVDQKAQKCAKMRPSRASARQHAPEPYETCRLLSLLERNKTHKMLRKPENMEKV